MLQVKHNLEILLDTSQNILLLQGCAGDFLTQLSNWLKTQRKTVYKINFNGGDEYYYPETIPNTFAFTDKIENFSVFLSAFIEKYHIESIICYSDTRQMHKIAKQISLEKNLHFWTMEEGYFRPFFITVEKDGFNYFSPIPKQADFFLKSLPYLKHQEYKEPQHTPAHFWKTRFKSLLYFWHKKKKSGKYPHNQHHRNYKVWDLIRFGIAGEWRRLKFRFYDKSLERKVEQCQISNFYILPLQLFDDAQISVHSDFSSVEEFLMTVLQSFADNAPIDLKLIVKHHPWDLYFKDYTKQIKEFIKCNPQCKGRIFYIHSMPLPVLLRKGQGMIVINSTCGMSALLHLMPVLAFGRVNYNMAGLTDQGSLENFWHNPTPPNAELVHAFRQYHMNVTQVVGTPFSKVHWSDFSQKEIK